MAEKKTTAYDLQKEPDYYMALVFNDKLLEAGLITEEIHDMAKREFIDSYRPALAPLMPSNR